MALNNQKPQNLTSLSAVSTKFIQIEGIFANLIDNECEKIALHFGENEIEKQRLATLSIEKFWHEPENIKNFQDICEFENVVNLAKLCMYIPHRNAKTEPVFSVVTDIRTKIVP